MDAIRKNTKFIKDVPLDSVDYQIGNNDFIVEGLNAEDLMKLINSMPEGYKVIFNMFAIEGYSHQEISTTLGISESTSKSQYMRAKGYLRNRLEVKVNE
jgi:RNA polymerase sigma-70 factor (ECF subfamily)